MRWSAGNQHLRLTAGVTRGCFQRIERKWLTGFDPVNTVAVREIIGKPIIMHENGRRITIREESDALQWAWIGEWSRIGSVG